MQDAVVPLCIGGSLVSEGTPHMGPKGLQEVLLLLLTAWKELAKEACESSCERFQLG